MALALWDYSGFWAWAATKPPGPCSTSCGGRWFVRAASACRASWRWTRRTGGTRKQGFKGRRTQDRALIIVAAEENGKGIGRIRLRCIPDLTRACLHGFIAQAIEPGSTVRTDGLNAYRELTGYLHDRLVQRRQTPGEHLLPRVHRVISLLKRWLMGTHQGAIGHDHLNDYLDEFAFRFNRRTSASRGKLFYRLAQQAVQVDPAPFAILIKPQPVGLGGVK